LSNELIVSVFLRVPIRTRELSVAGFSAFSSEHPASKLNGATMFRIITIEREYGCGAGEIAQKLADRLHWKLWDQLLAHEVARHARCKPCEVEQREERRDPIYYRLLKSFVRGSYEGALRADQVEMLDADSIFRISKRVIEQAASDGECVIVGRGIAAFSRAPPRCSAHLSLRSRNRKSAAPRIRGQHRIGRSNSGGYRGPRARCFYQKVF